MSHYICTGSCNANSDSAGICETKGCNMEGQEMQNCNCADGFHNRLNGEDLADNLNDSEVF